MSSDTIIRSINVTTAHGQQYVLDDVEITITDEEFDSATVGEIWRLVNEPGPLEMGIIQNLIKEYVLENMRDLEEQIADEHAEVVADQIISAEEARSAKDEDR